MVDVVIEGSNTVAEKTLLYKYCLMGFSVLISRCRCCLALLNQIYLGNIVFVVRTMPDWQASKGNRPYLLVGFETIEVN